MDYLKAMSHSLWLVCLRPKDNLFWIRVGWPSLRTRSTPLHSFSLSKNGVDSWFRTAQSFAADTLTMSHSLWLTVISGTALDPLADKITMLFIYSAFYLHNDIPSWLFMTIIGRDIALVRHTLVQNVTRLGLRKMSTSSPSRISKYLVSVLRSLVFIPDVCLSSKTTDEN